jgi:hypothetical protein
MDRKNLTLGIAQKVKIARDHDTRLMSYCELRCIIYFLLLQLRTLLIGAQDEGLKKAPPDPLWESGQFKSLVNGPFSILVEKNTLCLKLRHIVALSHLDTDNKSKFSFFH